MQLVVINHVTLDGVFQAPGKPDEDTSDGFGHGGWAAPRGDETMQAAISQGGMGRPHRGLLLGRKTYNGILSSWNERGGPFKDALNSAPKYVVSSNPETKLQWPNSTLVHGDIPASVAEIKEGSAGDLVIMGSGKLIRSLMPHRLIDEYLLLVHPMVLGSGVRLFEHDNHLTELRLVECTTTTKGVILATYRPA